MTGRYSADPQGLSPDGAPLQGGVEEDPSGPAGHLSAKITVLMLEVDGKYSFLPGSISGHRYEGKEAQYVLSVRRLC